MLTLSVISFASLAVLLEFAWRAPDMNEHGRIVGPSLRDQLKGRGHD